MRLFLNSFVVTLIILFNGCEKSATMQTSPSAQSGEVLNDSVDASSGPKAVMYVHGMACPQCAYNVDLQLLKVAGVKDVKVNMASGIVTALLAAENPPTQEQLAAAIRETGFTLVKIEMK